MKILSIDTTSMLGSIALSEDAKLIAEERQGVPGTHSERLLSSISHLLNLAGWSKTDIGAIAVALGPGSFTGLRIGLGTAKGMALALGCPIVGVSSLLSLALNGRDFSGTVVSVIDARRKELYAAAFQFKGKDKPKVVIKACVLSPQMLVKKIKVIKGSVLLTGDGVIAYGEIITKALGKRACISHGTGAFPSALNLAILALPKFKNKKGDDIAGLVPNYVRESDAEIGFKGK